VARLTGVRDGINRDLVDACRRHEGRTVDRLMAVFDDPSVTLEVQLEAGRRAFGVAAIRKIIADGRL
jgi:hypothetical protein